jgi:RND superfamily putative drug exporter
MTQKLALASARRPWTAIGAWALALLVAVLASFTLLSGALTSEAGFSGNPDSKQAETLLEERLANPNPVDEVVVVRSEELTVDDPAFARFAEQLRVQGAATGVVASGRSYFETGDESLVSADRHATTITLDLAGEEPDVAGLVRAVEDANGTSGFAVSITGVFTGDHDFRQLADEDLKTGEFLGLAAALVILVAVFGAFVASIVPVVLGVVSIAIAVGLAAVVGQAFELSFFVVNMITMMGLAVGIDYSLFVISRFREERARGREKLEAIGVAGATSSRAVLFSGLTVVLALLGMLLVPTTIFRSLALGAILVVAVSVLAAMTLLPAVLSLLGDRVDALGVPFVGRRAAGGEARGFWSRVTAAVLRRPGLALAATTAVLLAAAVPALSLDTGSAGITTLPDRFESKRGFVALERDFPATLLAPAQVVIDGDVGSQPVQAAIENLQTSLAELDSFGAPALVTNEAGDLALLSVPLRGEATGDAAVEAVRDLRADLIPDAFDGVGARVVVGGATAEEIDFVDLTASYLPIVITFVLGLSFLLLMVAFRSIVIPAMSIVMNLLSVGAAYGLMVLVFQYGVGNELLGFRELDTIEPWIPLFLFSVLFGLSMDYHVFLLSRIRERYDETRSTADAISHGVRSTARLITGAALIMVAVFGGFAAGDLVMFQQMGFGLGVAVLLDATIVRSVLVPATMTLLGRWNWYLPSWLGWLPKIGVEAPRELAFRPAGK